MKTAEKNANVGQDARIAGKWFAGSATITFMVCNMFSRKKKQKEVTARAVGKVKYYRRTFGSLRFGSPFKAAPSLSTWWVKASKDTGTSFNGELVRHWLDSDIVWILATGTVNAQSL